LSLLRPSIPGACVGIFFTQQTQAPGMLGRSSDNHDWLLANASACVSCGFRLRNARNARNASDYVWMETGLEYNMTGWRDTCALSIVDYCTTYRENRNHGNHGSRDFRHMQWFSVIFRVFLMIPKTDDYFSRKFSWRRTLCQSIYYSQFPLSAEI